jgi:hypothetical protein
MTDPITSLGPAVGSRRVARRADAPEADDQNEAAAAGSPGLPAVVEGPAEPEPPRPRRFGFTDFAAQILGGAPRRGLRGGPETLERARSTYLETEWSGPSDRRLRTGRITKTDV